MQPGFPTAGSRPRTSPPRRGFPRTSSPSNSGCKSKPVAGPGETTAFMGLAAARKALAMAGLEAGAVDLVIWCGAQHKDYPCWLAGLYVADQLGARKAWSFDMEAMCGSMMAALDVAKSLMLAQPELRHRAAGLGLPQQRPHRSRRCPETRFMMDIGSGGSALVLGRDAGRNEVLASAFRGDGSLSEMCVVPALGAKAWPPAPGDQDRAHFVVPDEEAFKGKLGEVTMPNFYAVIRESLRLSGLPGGRHRLPGDPALQAQRPRRGAGRAGPSAGTEHLPGRLRPPRPERPGAVPGTGAPGRQDPDGRASSSWARAWASSGPPR